MTPDQLDPTLLMLQSIRGSAFNDVELAEGMWQFSSSVGSLLIECPWKAIEAGSVVLGSADHQQKYGLPEPIDGLRKIKELLVDRIVEAVQVDSVTSDLSVTFTRDFRIAVFNDSSGYEGWTYSDCRGLKLVAMGDGRMAIWKGES